MSNIHIRRISTAVTGLALVGGALLGGAKTASAAPTTLSYYPSTDMYSKKVFHFDADHYMSTNAKNTAATSLGLEYGLGPDTDKIFGRTEFGADFLTSAAGQSYGDRMFVNAKTQLFSNATSRITFGGYGFGTKDSGAANWLNLLGSKTFGFGRITLGGAYATRKANVIGSRSAFQVGYDKAITDKFIFAADYQTGKGQFISPSIIYLINDKAGVQLAYGRGGSAYKGSGIRDQIYFGFDYSWGGPPAVANPVATATTPVNP